MRSRLMLEVASHLVAQPDWGDKQVEIHLRPQGNPDWRLCFFASDAPNAVDAVMSGAADVAICNPGGILAMACRGVAPFDRPMPLRAIMVLPQFDQFAFAVSGATGITSLADLRDKKYPLRLSLRGQPDHSVHLVTNLVLSTYGFSLDDITTWGGQVRYDEGTPGSGRIQMAERGEIDAIFDEALNTFGRKALELGWRFLPVDKPNLKELEAMGLRRVAITPREYPGVNEDVWTVDFSGWPVFTREDAPDAMVSAFCAGLDARKDRIPWYGTGPMNLSVMVSDTREAPMAIPLHPAAERYWRAHGYLK
jgi:TRAP-type uncharacterized transport system substrate-binding protein